MGRGAPGLLLGFIRIQCERCGIEVVVICFSVEMNWSHKQTWRKEKRRDGGALTLARSAAVGTVQLG